MRTDQHSVHSMAGRIAGALAALGLLGLVVPGSSLAQDDGGGIHFGPQIDFADDTDIGVGARVSGDLGGYPGWEIMGSFDLYFPDGDADFWEINGNALYNIDVRSTTVFPYAGGGVNIARLSAGNASSTDLGLNLLGGVKFATDARFIPYAELRATLEGSEQVVVTAGVLFP